MFSTMQCTFHLFQTCIATFIGSVAKGGDGPVQQQQARPSYWLETSKEGDTWLFFKEGALALGCYVIGS